MEACLPAVHGRLGLRLSSDTTNIAQRFTPPFYSGYGTYRYPTYNSDANYPNGIAMNLALSSPLFNSDNIVRPLSYNTFILIRY